MQRLAIILFIINNYALAINQSTSTLTICSSTQYYDSGGLSSNYNNSESSKLTLLPCNAGEYITISFSSFKTEEGWDYLYIYDGDDTTNLIGIYTGSVSPGTITSTVGALTIKFVSDGNTSEEGWNATINSTFTQGALNTAITQPTLGSVTQIITCQNPYIYYDSGSDNDYSNNENGVITFTPSTSGKYVTIVFDRNTFSVENNGSNDCYDYINIYDGDDVNSIFLGSFCNNNIPITFTSSDNTGALTIEFISDGALTKSGWKASVFCSDNKGVNKIVQPASGSIEKTIVCGETYNFYDPGIDKDYSPNQNSILTICPEMSGQNIVFDITSSSYSTVCLNYNGDYLNIYNGDNINAELLAQVNSCDASFNDLLPLTATSSSGCLTFEFYSNSDRYTAYGWLAEIYCSSFLPIELAYFEAKADKNSIKLNWATHSEINNDYFTIEKSNDGINFKPILIKKGAGNSNELIQYKAEDNDVITSTTYYRLKQTDFDGNYEYVRTVSVKPDSFDDVKIYPNPNNGNFKIQTNNIDYYELLDAQGKLILRSSKPEVNIQKTQTGLYILKLYNKSTITTKKVIIRMPK